MMENQGRKVKIVAAGHISLDITPVFNNSGEQRLHQLFQPGKLLRVGAAGISAGGSVSNTGLALHKLGAQATLMAAVGDDRFGQILGKLVADHGCNASIAVKKDVGTSYTVVLAPRGIDRFFLHDPGCNDHFCCEDLDFREIGAADHFHFGYPTLMRRFYMDEGQELVRVFRKVKGMGLTTSLDLAMVDPETEAGACDWRTILGNVLPYVDFFVPSVEELGYMLDRELYQDWQQRAAGGEITSMLSLGRDVEPLAGLALGLGAKAVLLKCGAAGMYLRTAPGARFAGDLSGMTGWGGICHFEDSFVPDRIASATGAGDTSIAAFLTAALMGYQPFDCVRYAAATGACCVGTYDTVSGLLDFDGLQKKMEQGWRRQRLIGR